MEHHFLAKKYHQVKVQRILMFQPWTNILQRQSHNMVRNMFFFAALPGTNVGTGTQMVIREMKIHENHCVEKNVAFL